MKALWLSILLLYNLVAAYHWTSYNQNSWLGLLQSFFTSQAQIPLLKYAADQHDNNLPRSLCNSKKLLRNQAIFYEESAFEPKLTSDSSQYVFKANADGTLPEGWEYCGDPSLYTFQLDSVTITPFPPRRGKQLRVNVKGKLLEKVDGTAKFSYSVKLGPLLVVRDNTTVCEALDLDPTLPHCPLEQGDWNYTYDGIIPFEVPMGTFSIFAQAEQADGRQIMCVSGKINIKLLNSLDTKHRLLTDKDDKLDQIAEEAASIEREPSEYDFDQAVDYEGIDLQ